MNTEKELVAGISKKQNFARAVSYSLSPLTSIPFLFFVLALWFIPDPAKVTWIAIIGFVFYGFIPLLMLITFLNRGEIKSLDVHNRSKRKKPFLAALISYFFPLFIYFFWFNEFEIIWITALSILICAITTATITQFWKISIHSSSFAIVYVSLLTGWISTNYITSAGIIALIVGFILLIIVSWSRVQLKAHSVNQVIVGILTAVVIHFLVISITF